MVAGELLTCHAQDLAESYAPLSRGNLQLRHGSHCVVHRRLVVCGDENRDGCKLLGSEKRLNSSVIRNVAMLLVVVAWEEGWRV